MSRRVRSMVGLLKLIHLVGLVCVFYRRVRSMASLLKDILIRLVCFFFLDVLVLWSAL